MLLEGLIEIVTFLKRRRGEEVVVSIYNDCGKNLGRKLLVLVHQNRKCDKSPKLYMPAMFTYPCHAIRAPHNNM